MSKPAKICLVAGIAIAVGGGMLGYRPAYVAWCAYRFRLLCEGPITYTDRRGTAHLAQVIFLNHGVRPGMGRQEVLEVLGAPDGIGVTRSGETRCVWTTFGRSGGFVDYAVTFDDKDRAVFVPKPYTYVDKDGRSRTRLYTTPEAEAFLKSRSGR